MLYCHNITLFSSIIYGFKCVWNSCIIDCLETHRHASLANYIRNPSIIMKSVQTHGNASLIVSNSSYKQAKTLKIK